MPSPDSYMKDTPAHSQALVVARDGQNSPRGRAISQKDLLAIQGEHDNADLPKSLKIKLTLPAGFRKGAVETATTVSRPSRNATRKVATTATVSPTALPKRGRPRKNKNSGEADEYAPPRGLKPPHKTKTTAATVIRSSASGPSRQPQHHQIYHPSPDHHKPRFPTFVPASVLSSDDLSGSEDSELSGEETEEDELPDDLVANDRAIAHDRAHTHRKLFESEEDQIPTRVPWKYNNHTNSRRTTPVVKTPIEIDDGSRSSGNEEDDEQSSDEDEEDDDDEDEEEGAEAEGEPDHPTPMQTTGLSDEEDDTMDAQLFFSHLLDESSESEDEAHSDGDSITGDMVAGAAELSDTETDIEIEGLEHPMMVKEGWDGELVFSTEIHPPTGLLDFTFGHDDSHLELSSSQTDSLANSLSTLPVTQSATISDNEEFEEAESLAGDTTDDEIMPPGLASFPPSTSTISPFATFTPAKAMASMHQLTKGGALPSPADVMAARNSFTWDMLSSPVNSIAATDDAPPRSRSASTHSLGYRGPKMGFFNGAVFGSMRTIIGDAGGKLPSPFSTLVPPAPTYRRKRRANSDLGSFFNKRTRNSHSLQSSYFSDDLITAPQGDLVDLDDLLDASLLSEDIDKPSNETTNDATPNKWDRIPMNIYRQTRNIPAAHGSSVSFSFDIGGFGSPPSPSLSKPAYVPPNRTHVSHGSIDSILWEDEFMSPSLVRRPNHHQHNKKRHREHEIEFDIDSLLLPSSRAGPSRGDRTPTQSRSMAGESSADFLSEAKSRKDRRKEKKREKACLQKQILSALDETLADYDELMAAEEDITP
ncbi:hypothetical protein M408DRAFT_5703 [Serendipita vermifera MAFF 305830]|uniref:Uncharacterized protein n=1 Tax=Serendipita vermifera MAFF 305830 TaxID=933852 RepID=A0A0C3BQX9_SERVB|nr:hypothetical protein M408DRAFT_5703 [Serendipita vermifera MAFF 305830]